LQIQEKVFQFLLVLEDEEDVQAVSVAMTNSTVLEYRLRQSLSIEML